MNSTMLDSLSRCQCGPFLIMVWHSSDIQDIRRSIHVSRNGLNWPVVKPIQEVVDLWLQSTLRGSLTLQEFFDKVGHRHFMADYQIQDSFSVQIGSVLWQYHYYLDTKCWTLTWEATVDGQVLPSYIPSEEREPTRIAFDILQTLNSQYGALEASELLKKVFNLDVNIKRYLTDE